MAPPIPTSRSKRRKLGAVKTMSEPTRRRYTSHQRSVILEYYERGLKHGSSETTQSLFVECAREIRVPIPDLKVAVRNLRASIKRLEAGKESAIVKLCTTLTTLQSALASYTNAQKLLKRDIPAEVTQMDQLAVQLVAILKQSPESQLEISSSTAEKTPLEAENTTKTSVDTSSVDEVDGTVEATESPPTKPEQPNLENGNSNKSAPNLSSLVIDNPSIDPSLYPKSKKNEPSDDCADDSQPELYASNSDSVTLMDAAQRDGEHHFSPLYMKEQEHSQEFEGASCDDKQQRNRARSVSFDLNDAEQDVHDDNLLPPLLQPEFSNVDYNHGADDERLSPPSSPPQVSNGYYNACRARRDPSPPSSPPYFSTTGYTAGRAGCDPYPPSSPPYFSNTDYNFSRKNRR